MSLSTHLPSLEILYAEAWGAGSIADNLFFFSVFIKLYGLHLGAESLLPFTLTCNHTVATPMHIATGLFIRTRAQACTASSAGRCQVLCPLMVSKPSLQQRLPVLWLHAFPTCSFFVFLPERHSGFAMLTHFLPAFKVCCVH